MDDDTQRLLARYQHRMANTNALYRRAEMLNARAEEIERSLDLPIHQRPLEDETTLRLEAKLARQEADACTRDADGMQARLHRPPSQELTEEIEAWAARKPEEREW